jgi:hypothetical protein
MCVYVQVQQTTVTALPWVDTVDLIQIMWRLCQLGHSCMQWCNSFSQHQYSGCIINCPCFKITCHKLTSCNTAHTATYATALLFQAWHASALRRYWDAYKCSRIQSLDSLVCLVCVWWGLLLSLALAHIIANTSLLLSLVITCVLNACMYVHCVVLAGASHPWCMGSQRMWENISDRAVLKEAWVRATA